MDAAPPNAALTTVNVVGNDICLWWEFTSPVAHPSLSLAQISWIAQTIANRIIDHETNKPWVINQLSVCPKVRDNNKTKRLFEHQDALNGPIPSCDIEDKGRFICTLSENELNMENKHM